MFRTTRSRCLTAGAIGLALAAAPISAYAGAGTGSVTTTVSATVLAGGLTIAGAGVSDSVQSTPGAWSSTLGINALAVTDTTGTTNGWAVTATYSDPPAGPLTPLGADNVEVSSSGVTPNALGGVASANVTTVTDIPLSTPVTVLTTGSNSGAGITAATTSVKVRVPQTATLAQTFGGVVTYTVASVR